MAKPIPLAVACLVTGLVAVGCSAGGGRAGDAADSAAPRRTASVAPADPAQRIPGGTVDRAPRVGGRVAVSVASARGSRELALDGGVRPGTLDLAVTCEGTGTVTVELSALGLSVPVRCVAGAVSGTQDAFAQGAAFKDATVRVTASPGVRWALSVGSGKGRTGGG